MIATWNVRKLSDPSKQAQVAREMDTYKLEILGLADNRWVGRGDEQQQSSHYFLYAGYKAEILNGLGIIISKECRKYLKGFNPISERIITALFFSRSRNITVVQCYASTDPSDDIA